MPSLTPGQFAEEVSNNAFKEGLLNGTFALIPSYGAVWAAMKYPKFVKSTNWQSRTALVIMPALFTFAFTAEMKLSQQMQQMASDKDHARDSAEWAERKHAEQKRLLEENKKEMAKESVSAELEITQLYRQSVENSGVRIVPELGLHHRIANFWQENPIKVLACMAAPAVAYIFYGRSGQQHLQLQMKVMHTRVMGQFTVLTMLLTLMGFKQYMDSNGKFITEADAQRRVEQMQTKRKEMLERLKAEKEWKEQLDKKMALAHQEDLTKNKNRASVLNKKRKKEEAEAVQREKLESHAV
mmetsp:Transcript_17736/g.26906  ORF Transcript_17736/g.26906 Transcript_17736/m.26906 type:complete len:298 (+) Transcript_17736:182-1075(+)|eukprot:CAMPEP_0178918738 /NCGR_PEP_ID=MMETSP0786-20121207/13992_1 /TAXON_ID=186022 /ORGANISM="Thalassionema frauenfeldii, Strain CCMP 1798" /LENGTH=297 /DNA_ID=CAMNT_0020592479 /DNA_START=94 /DNA_END=987 /DNA_ORIENTATION=+